jgi:tripartite-type tricarboxylate transporter receptor subunit TctC
MNIDLRFPWMAQISPIAGRQRIARTSDTQYAEAMANAGVLRSARPGRPEVNRPADGGSIIADSSGVHMIQNLVPALSRRALLTAFYLSLFLACTPSIAQDVVRIIVPVPPGGGLDGTARALASGLSALTGESYIVENRPGANTALGADLVARAPADGRTILYSGTAIVMNPWLQKLGPSPVTDLQPVIYLSNSNYVLIAGSDGAIRSVSDLQARATSPAGLSCAAPPGPMALACEQLKSRLAGTVIVVPYLGIAPAVAALLGGHVDAAFVNFEGVESLLQAGSVRAIAASARSTAAGVPLIGHVWPGLYLEGFTGLFVPARTPAAKVRELNEAVNQVLAQPAFRKFMADSRQEIVGGPSEQFSRKISSAYERYGEVIRKANLANASSAPAVKTQTQ